MVFLEFFSKLSSCILHCYHFTVHTINNKFRTGLTRFGCPVRSVVADQVFRVSLCWVAERRLAVLILMRWQ